MLLDPATQAGGTGVILKETQNNKDCLLTVATAKHVLAGVEAIMSTTGHYESGRKMHPKLDLAIVTITRQESCGANKLEVAKTSYEALGEGARIWSVGYPRLKRFVGVGVLGEPYTGCLPEWEGCKLAYIYVQPGSSGSPIFHDDKVVAILVGGSTEMPFRAIVLPIHLIKEILDAQ